MSKIKTYLTGPERVVCEFCSLIWAGAILATCTYLVFWQDHSGWWYLLAIPLASGWQCYQRTEEPDSD